MAEDKEEELAQAFKKLAPMFGVMEDIRSNLNAQPLDWELESPASDVLVARRTITVPGLGDLSCITFNSKIAPDGGGFTCYVRSIATPIVLEGSETVGSLEEAMEGAVKKMILHAGSILLLEEHSPKRRKR